MARPRAMELDEDAVAAILAADGDLAVRVTPGARIEALERVGGVLHAKVRARAQDGKANEAVRHLLARALRVAPSRCVLLRGSASRDKLFRILP